MSDYLTDEEQLARFKSWWDENGTATIVGLLLVIVGVIGWRWYDGYRADTTAAASDLYQSFLESEGDSRATVAATIASEAPDTAYHALTLMHLARDAVATGDYEAAERHLQAGIAAAPEPELADVGRLRLARVQQQGDRSEIALQTLGAIRSEGFRSYVAELKGDIHLARGERSLAHESYSAALADETDEGRRPVLEMKIADSADSAFLRTTGPAAQPADEATDELPAGDTVAPAASAEVDETIDAQVSTPDA